jgi:predicted nicotinamide N-methyase
MKIAGDQIDKPSIAYWQVHSAGASRKTNDRQDQIGSQWWAALRAAGIYTTGELGMWPEFNCDGSESA